MNDHFVGIMWIGSMWDIAWLHRISEISFPKPMNIISTVDYNELVIVFMLYNYFCDVDFSVLHTPLERFTEETATS